MTGDRTSNGRPAAATGEGLATPPTIDLLDALTAAGFAAAVAPLFEGAPRFLARLAAARPFGSVDVLFYRARQITRTMPLDEQIELIDAHPRLGAPQADVSALSFIEQGYGLDPAERAARAAAGAADAERVRVAAELDRLNAAYEARFGFRYCAFVAGRSHAELLPEMSAALDADRGTEIARALDAVVDIARDRHVRLTAPDAGESAMIELAANRYGKAAIRLVRVVRGPGGYRDDGDGGGGADGGDLVRDLTVAVALEGAFEAAHTDGDNSMVVATDTMKNTAYAFAASHLDGAIEDYGRALAEHFLETPQVDLATVNVREHLWMPIPVGGAPAPDAFVRGGVGTRVATIAASRGGTTVEAGIDDLFVMKTTRSAFSGFPRDRYTTLPETDDRLMATKITAIWRYGSPDLDADVTFAAVRSTLLEVFADHDSPSVQTSIWIMAKAILERHDEVDEVRMVLPNLHHWLVDLSPFGLANEREIYTPTTEPHGLIEATVRRSAT